MPREPEWTDEELKDAAEHAEKCSGPPDCRGRFPNYDSCSVAAMAVELIAARKTIAAYRGGMDETPD